MTHPDVSNLAELYRDNPQAALELAKQSGEYSDREKLDKNR